MAYSGYTQFKKLRDKGHTLKSLKRSNLIHIPYYRDGEELHRWYPTDECLEGYEKQYKKEQNHV